jgi:hypothetical protein
MNQRTPASRSIFLTVYAQLLFDSSSKTQLDMAEIEGNIFSSPSVPQISMIQYIERLVFNMELDKSTIICSLIYIDRYCNYTKHKLNSYTIHRLILTSMLLALKYNEDLIYHNSYYAVVGGVSLEELNALESDFLKKVEYRLYIEKADFSKYKSFIHKIMKSREN